MCSRLPGRAKIQLIGLFLALDINLVITDIDTAWMRNPLPFFDRYPTADCLTSTDQLTPTVNDESLEIYPQVSMSRERDPEAFSCKHSAASPERGRAQGEGSRGVQLQVVRGGGCREGAPGESQLQVQGGPSQGGWVAEGERIQLRVWLRAQRQGAGEEGPAETTRGSSRRSQRPACVRHPRCHCGGHG
eukprot:365865-Chlamydomonas_euryale.AAC.16